MDMNQLEAIKYPIGRFQKPDVVSPTDRESWITTLERFPNELEGAIYGLNEQQLNTPYREGGWTVLQLVNHMADSHANMYMRIRLALTEDNPVIKPYKEAAWAELTDSKTAPVAFSLQMLRGMHTRLILLLRSLGEDELDRCFIHPEHNRTVSIVNVISLYAWHCNHHLAHILNLRKANNW
jgi:hypothetical protein